jgi:hypothetical protein
VLRIYDPAALFVDHLLPQTMAGLGIDLVEVRLLRLRGGREQFDRAGDAKDADDPSSRRGAWRRGSLQAQKQPPPEGSKQPWGGLAATVSNIGNRGRNERGDPL